MGVETREKFRKELFGTRGKGDGDEKWDGPNVFIKCFSTSEGLELRTFFFSLEEFSKFSICVESFGC